MTGVPRRLSRGEALQILYQLDLNHELTTESAVFYFEKNFSKAGKTVDNFTHRLVTGVAQNLAQLDTLLKSTKASWRLERMAVVDRNILRLGLFEMNYCDDIPATVTINEMVELAKQFGAAETPPFVNGVLDELKSKIQRPAKVP